MISRDPRGASSQRYDLVVVGGGIYGCALTLEAARRGLRPLLLEREDFGQHTSWNSLRIIHGGLRYLQTLDLRRFFESVAERRWWLATFPDLVRPLPCVMPLYGRGLHRNSVLRLALGVNDLLGWRRNRGVVPEENRLPAGRLLSAAETAEHLPHVERAGLKGAALWYDAVMPDSQRLLIELLRWAAACGATCLNYVEAEELRVEAGRARCVVATDKLSGESFEFAAPIVINSCGPWSRDTAGRFDRDVDRLFRPSLALNLLLDQEPRFSVAAVAVPPRRRARTYFLLPWKGKVLAGTYHAPWTHSLEHDEGRAEHVERFLGELQAAAPALNVDAKDVLRVFWGQLPVVRAATDKLATRELIHDHGANDGPQGLYSISGVKFTMARRVAEKTLRALGGGAAGLSAPSSTEPPATNTPPTLEEFRALLDANPAAARQLVRRLADEESAVCLSDLFFRRTDWGMVPGRFEPLVPRLSELLPWDAAGAAAARPGPLGRGALDVAQS